LTSENLLRTLVEKVKPSTETVVCASMHGGVRGWGVIPAYSI